MSAIARTLGVSRSNLIERTNKPSKPRGSYRKPDDIVLLAELRLSRDDQGEKARQTR